MTTLNPEILARKFISNNFENKDYSLRSVTEFILTCDIFVGHTPVTFAAIFNHYHKLSETVWHLVQKEIEKPTAIETGNKPFEVTFRIARHQFTQIVGINVRDLVTTIGLSLIHI